MRTGEGKDPAELCVPIELEVDYSYMTRAAETAQRVGDAYDRSMRETGAFAERQKCCMDMCPACRQALGGEVYAFGPTNEPIWKYVDAAVRSATARGGTFWWHMVEHTNGVRGETSCRADRILERAYDAACEDVEA